MSKKKKIFITGVNSFIGRDLIPKLSKNFIVYGIDKMCRDSKNFKQMDLCSKELSEFIPDDTDVVVHLAAVSNEERCSESLSDCYQTNIVGLINLLQIISKKKIQNLIHASTEWVYSTYKREHKEEDIIDYRKFTSHYAFSKFINEQQLRMFFKAKKIKAISCLRFGIIYGHRRNNWSAMESIVDKVINSDKIEIGSKRTGRHFINVEDVSKSIMSSFKNQGFKLLNIQGKDFITLDKLIKETASHLNKNIKITERNKMQPSIKRMSINKAKKEINFKPSLSFNERLKKLINYLKKKENEKRDY